MTSSPTPPEPAHSKDEVLSLPIVASGDTPRETPYYATLGVTFRNLLTLNLSSPHEIFPSNRFTTLAEFQDDHTGADVPFDRIFGHSLKNLIYHLKAGYPLYYAVLDDHHYLTAHDGFNYTVFAFGSFSAWLSGGRSQLSWTSPDLLKEPFYNAWTHELIDPFSVYE